MAVIQKRESGNWGTIVRKNGWPTTIKTFRTKRDAEDWARRIEDGMVRGVYLSRAPSEKLMVAAALKRYTPPMSGRVAIVSRISQQLRNRHTIPRVSHTHIWR